MTFLPAAIPAARLSPQERGQDVKRVAVFDLDGRWSTVAAHRRCDARCVHRARSASADLRANSAHCWSQFAEAIQALADLPVARYPDLGMAYKEAFIRTWRAPEPMYDGARAALETLHEDGWILGIATGKARRGLEYIHNHHNPRSFRLRLLRR